MNNRDWANYFSKQEDEQKAESSKDKRPLTSIKDQVRQLTQKLVNQGVGQTDRNSAKYVHFRSSEKTSMSQSGAENFKRIHSEKAKESSKQDLSFGDHSKEPELRKGLRDGDQLFKMAVIKEPATNNTAQSSNMPQTAESKRYSSFERRLERPFSAKDNDCRSQRGSVKFNKQNLMQKEVEAKRFKNLNQEVEGDLRRLRGLDTRERKSTSSNNLLTGDNLVLKVAGKTRQTEPVQPVSKEFYPPVRTDFSLRNNAEKPRPGMSRKEKKIQSDLYDIELVTQTALNRIHEKGLIKHVHGVINNGDVISRLMVEMNAYAKIVTVSLLSMTEVRGMTLAKIEVQNVDNLYKKDLSLKAGSQLMALFRFGSEVDVLAKMMPNVVLNLLNPDTVVCAKSGAKYLLIKYYRIKK